MKAHTQGRAQVKSQIPDSSWIHEFGTAPSVPLLRIPQSAVLKKETEKEPSRDFKLVWNSPKVYWESGYSILNIFTPHS